MNKRVLIGLALGAAVAIPSTSQAYWVYSEATFLAAIQPGYYLEDFSSLTYGALPNPYNAPGANGFDWEASSPSGMFAYAPPTSPVYGISNNSPLEAMRTTMTGLPVTALGGYLANTDESGTAIAGDVTVTLSNGATTTVAGSSYRFIGWVGDDVLSWADFSVTDTPPLGNNNWVGLSNYYVGASSVPEPFTMALMGAAGLTGYRKLRRRRSAAV